MNIIIFNKIYYLNIFLTCPTTVQLIYPTCHCPRVCQQNASERISMSLSSLVGQIRCATNEQQPRQRQRQRPRPDNGQGRTRNPCRTTTSRAPQPSPAGRCAAGHFDSGCDCDWEHGANVTNMGMKCASDKSNILTNFHVAAPHYHPAKGAEPRGLQGR